jgi:hypothetical protein
VKKRRINWGEGAEKVKLDAVIKEWEGGKDVAKDSSKRRVRGESVERAPLVGKEDQRFLACRASAIGGKGGSTFACGCNGTERPGE